MMQYSVWRDQKRLFRQKMERPWRLENILIVWLCRVEWIRDSGAIVVRPERMFACPVDRLRRSIEVTWWRKICPIARRASST